MIHTTPPAKAKGRRLLELDVLRGFAAVAVLLGHYTTLYDHLNGVQDRLGFEFTIGGYGVFLFFVISGFVIKMTIDRCNNWRDFAVSRFSRIFPAYWVALVITFLILLWLKEEPPTLVQLVANFTMLQRFFGIQHIDAVYWTLNVELSFYIWIMLARICGLLNNINLLVSFALLFQLFISLLQSHLGIRFSQGIQAVFLLEYVNLFSAGILFFEIWSKRGNIASWVLILWCLFNVPFIPFRALPCQPSHAWTIVVDLVIFLIFWMAINSKLTWMVSQVTLYLGAISYSLYLVHDEVGRAVMKRLSDMGYSPHATFIAALALSIVLATLITYFVEKPAMKFLRRFYDQMKGAESASKRFI
jgi:peptidoglycan/LPS O-acetylase OafA/YrhL